MKHKPSLVLRYILHNLNKTTKVQWFIFWILQVILLSFSDFDLKIKISVRL